MDKIINPELVVVMPVYNAAAFLHASISSILSQTFQNFLFYIIDDGSTDESASIISGFQDNRIVYCRNSSNQGIIQTLNNTFQNISAKYIVRMDADDVALPIRLQRQVEFMNKNPEITIAGSWFKTIKDKVPFRTPLMPEEIAIALLENNPIAHPSVIIRKTEWDKKKLHYSELYPHAEDFACWINAVLKKCKLANIPEFLLLYREHNLQVSNQFKDLQSNSVEKAIKNYLYNIFPNFTSKNIDLSFSLFSNRIFTLKHYKEVKELVENNNFSNNTLNNNLLETYILTKIKLVVTNIYIVISDPTLRLLGEALTDKYYHQNLSLWQKLKFPIKLIKKLSLG